MSCFLTYIPACYFQVVESYKDLAFSEYARVGRALALYEVGDREEAIAEMEDVSISLKGYPGIFLEFLHPMIMLQMENAHFPLILHLPPLQKYMQLLQQPYMQISTLLCLLKTSLPLQLFLIPILQTFHMLETQSTGLQV